MMAHQNPSYLAFCTPGQNETKNKIQGYKKETNKNIHISLNEQQQQPPITPYLQHPKVIIATECIISPSSAYTRKIPSDN